MSNIINLLHWTNENRDKLTSKGFDTAWNIASNVQDAERKAKLDRVIEMPQIVPTTKKIVPTPKKRKA